jgi:hypothetical protein
MKYEDIKDFYERCETHPDHQTGMISYRMIERRLQEEIEELRQYIEQRKWVGLTDEEVQEIMEKTVATCSELDDFTGNTARLTWKNCEAKLREKNGG